MTKRTVAGLISAALLASPVVALADFTDVAQRAQAQANSLSREQLDNLNTRVVNDAFVTARIIGYDPAEIKALRAEVAQLRQENADLRAAFNGIEGTLKLVVSMLTALLAKL
jgi:hypothetical protein